jgi:hypothetical protein
MKPERERAIRVFVEHSEDGNGGAQWWRLAAGDLLTEIDRLRAATTWQPADTIPRDGKKILVLTESGVFAVQWMQSSNPDNWITYHESAHGEGWYIEDSKSDITALRGPSPTHWMDPPSRPGEAPQHDR